MITTTFQSATTRHTFLEVRTVLGLGVEFMLRHGDHTFGAVVVKDDIPHLAFTVLNDSGLDDYRTVEAKNNLRLRAEESTAASELAELEAEALELWNVVRDSQGRGKAENWIGIPDLVKERWLAVARRAREMRTEK